MTPLPYSIVKPQPQTSARSFFQILARQFPKDNKLYKTFNRNTIKISYSCMPNIKRIIDQHNKRILSQEARKENSRLCNCRNANNCPLSGKCLQESLVYQATVTTANDNKKATYVGLTEGQFKYRYDNHTASFRHANKRTSTELSSYIWSLKDKGIDFNITWKVLTRANACKNGVSRCNLCLAEKYFIIHQPHLATLNARSEMVTSCRHVKKFILKHL